MTTFKYLATSAAALLISASANALIINGNFDDDLNGWTSSPLGGGVSAVVKDGRTAAKIDDPTSVGVEWLTQSFYVPTGVTELTVTFDFRFDNFDASPYLDDWAGGTLFTLGTGLGDWTFGRELFSLTSATNGWVSYTGVFDVSGIWNSNPNARIQFGLTEVYGPGSGWQFFLDKTNSALYIDSVAVSTNGGVEVPEPATLALLGLGLAGLGAARRRTAA